MWLASENAAFAAPGITARLPLLRRKAAVQRELARRYAPSLPNAARICYWCGGKTHKKANNRFRQVRATSHFAIFALVMVG